MPEHDQVTSPRPGVNGGFPGDLARLRAEVGAEIESASRAFATAADALRGAIDVMTGEGVPPAYPLLHALGECHRRFLRLRALAARRAEGLGLPGPSPAEVSGLRDLARWLDRLPISVTGAGEPAPVAVDPGAIGETSKGS